MREPIARLNYKSDSRKFDKIHPNFVLRVNIVQDSSPDPWKEYALSISLDSMIRHLKGSISLNGLKKMTSNPRSRDNTKFCACHTDYGHLTEHTCS